MGRPTHTIADASSLRSTRAGAAARCANPTWTSLFTAAVGAILLLEAMGCDGEPPARARPEPVVVGAARDGGVVFVHPSNRCGQCHGTIERQWRSSAHARAASTPAFRAMLRLAPDATRCRACHEPLRTRPAAFAAAGREAITCDACHTVQHVRRDREPAFAFDFRSTKKYGPRCDSKPHYFHLMGCSPLHRTGGFCGGCHVLNWTTSTGVRLPVLSEYDEWKRGPYARAGVQCQSCHMPGTRAAVAEGAPIRAGVGHHGFLGAAGKLRRDALSLTLTARRTGARVEVTARLINDGAGHRVPTGLPAHEVHLEVSVRDAGGKVVARGERRYARILVDEAGRRVPFFRAVRVAADNRLPPRQARTERFSFTAPTGAVVVAEVRHHGLAAPIATVLGIAPTPGYLMVRARAGVVRARARPRPRVVPRRGAAR